MAAFCRIRGWHGLLALPLAAALARSGETPAGMRQFWGAPAVTCPTGAPPSNPFLACQSADVAAAGDAAWIAYARPEAGSPQAAWRVHVDRIQYGAAAPESSAASIVTVPGTMPRLAFASASIPVLVVAEEHGAGELRLVSRTGSASGRAWSKPALIPGPRHAQLVQVGRLSAAPRQLLLPVVWQDPLRGTTALHCARSLDAGATWKLGQGLPLHSPADVAPAVVQLENGQTVLILREQGSLWRSVSADGGNTWSRPAPLAVETYPGPVAVQQEAGLLTLAWTEPLPDTSLAPPGLQGVRRAVSTDAGVTWTKMSRLDLRPGRLPLVYGLATSQRDVLLLLGEQQGEQNTLACVSYNPQALESQRLPEPEQARGVYALDREIARASLQVLTAHTLHRPRRAERLFVEAYFMRSLVAAYSTLSQPGLPPDPWLDPRAGLGRAVSFADSLVETQAWVGFWRLGYAAVYYADMAAAVAIFPALEPHVDAERATRYEKAAERFVSGLQREHMLLPNGAVGIGRPIVIDPTGAPPASAAPYLVSTALAGIECQAWLYRRTGRAEYRERALAALDYTLSQIEPDGFAEEAARNEGSLRVACYVEEGWMAADQLLDDPAVLERLRRALVPHVEWLLRIQRLDGTWADDHTGCFARTPGIVNFLVWYDQRCQSSPAVRAAVRRASAVLIDPERWPAYGLFHNGLNFEVMRALSGRSLAAITAERFIL